MEALGILRFDSNNADIKEEALRSLEKKYEKDYPGIKFSIIKGEFDIDLDSGYYRDWAALNKLAGDLAAYLESGSITLTVKEDDGEVWGYIIYPNKVLSAYDITVTVSEDQLQYFTWTVQAFFNAPEEVAKAAMKVGQRRKHEQDG